MERNTIEIVKTSSAFKEFTESPSLAVRRVIFGESETTLRVYLRRFYTLKNANKKVVGVSSDN